MTEEKAIALDDSFLREVAGMTTSEDVGSIQTLPVLKINYDSDSIHPVGAWVVGQKKKDDVIVEEGQLVKGMVILAKRNRYSYYNEADTTKNCNSPLHTQGESVRGSNYRHVCGKGCPYRADGLDPRCQAQIVIYALALTADDKFVDCVSYMKGSNYMPLTEYMEAMVRVKSGSKMISVPTYTFLTSLGSAKKKNGSVVYYVGNYTRGPAFAIEQIRGFEKKREQVVNYIDSINAGISSEGSGHDKPAASTTVNNAAPYAPAAPSEEPPPWEIAKPGEPADDIEAAIAKAMRDM